MAPMETTLFYTLSTIAQTLAAAIAFLGAFVLFRLQSLGAVMRECGTYVGDYAGQFTNADPPEINRLNHSGDYAKLSALITPLFTESVALKTRREGLAKAVAASAAIRRDFRIALWAVIVVVGLAVTGLALTPQIAQNAGCTTVTLAFIVTGCVVALCLCAQLVDRALRESTI